MLTSAEFKLAGRVVRCTLRRSTRARWVSCFIRPESGLVVTLPPHAAPRDAETFLLQHQGWVLREMDLWTQRWAQMPRPWPYGPSLLYRGEGHEVVVRRARSGGVDRTSERQLLVRAPSAGIPGVRRVLQRWLQEEAAAALSRRVEALGTLMGLRAKRLYVRNLRASWGRCWQGGALSFNYRLIMAPPRILDYVVVHELAHIREPNHSPRFWQVVAGHFPAHRSARDWLRSFGPCLSV